MSQIYLELTLREITFIISLLLLVLGLLSLKNVLVEDGFETLP